MATTGTRVLAAATALLTLATTSCSAAEPAPSPTQGRPAPVAHGRAASTETKFRKGVMINMGVLTDLPGMGQLKVGPNTRSGFDNGLIGWLSSKIDFVPRHVDLTMAEREPAITNEPLLVDAVFAAFSITDGRKSRMDFAGPYLVNKQGVMVRADEKKIATISDLETKTICAPRGSTSIEELKARKMKVTEEESVEQCIDALKNNSVHGVSTDQLLLYGRARNDSSLRVLPKLTFGHYENYGIALPKNSGADCLLLTEHLKDFIRSGEWEKIFGQNFPDLASEADAYKPKLTAFEQCGP
ncbi:transporter substrate-binding domain-containing protein [Nonomuraea sp. NPDC049419]|uniref:transporter substrate-binding domain-containing protein n=1 Tax=Nonomuraea sp. NPDC049419 TaxID=3155772 RepID=UPI00343C3B08